MFTSDLTRRQRAWPGAACVALSPRQRGPRRRLCDRGAAQPQRAAAGRAVGGRRVNPSPASGRRFHDAKPQARRPGEERQVLDGAHGREPPVEAAPGRAPASSSHTVPSNAGAAAAGSSPPSGHRAGAARRARPHKQRAPRRAARRWRRVRRRTAVRGASLSPSNHTAVALVRRRVETARPTLTRLPATQPTTAGSRSSAPTPRRPPPSATASRPSSPNLRRSTSAR